MSEFTDLSQRMSGIEARQLQQDAALIRIGTTVDNNLASREWVRDVVAPVAEATKEIKHAVEMMGQENKTLNAAHNKLLEERAVREKEEHEAKMKTLESQTFSNLIKEKWAPLLGFLLAIAGFLSYLSNAFAQYVSHLPPVK